MCPCALVVNVLACVPWALYFTLDQPQPQYHDHSIVKGLVDSDLLVGLQTALAEPSSSNHKYEMMAVLWCCFPS